MLRRAAAALAVLILPALAPAPPAILGFTPERAARERFDEGRFLDLPSAQGALDGTAAIGTRPHYAGTPADRRLADYAAERLREYGFAVRVEPFVARVDTPRKLALELYPDGNPFVPRDGFHRQRGTPPIGIDLRERGDASDADTLDPAVGLPFNAGSGDGDVWAPLVYANYGMPGDFALLRRAGVDVRGAIVLVRYGRAFRGRKVQNAQTAGAAGAILYDDPADDGAARGATYPAGPWRPSTAVERGWVGTGVRIPVLPVSADVARTLLRTLHGANAPAGWAGALDAPYAVGKGPARVRLVVRMNHEQRTLWNTIGTIPGAAPEQSVVLGAHRDAWTYGAGDDGAGIASMLETARGLGYLARSGWRPKRSVVVALWDGEEVGLLGSSSFARAHPADAANCVAYLNADANLTGTTFGASAAGVLAPAIVAATAAVRDPARERTSLRDRWRAQPRGIAFDVPGRGDQASFLYAFGTPVAETGFGGAFGAYHSAYDTLRYAWTFSDPGFVLHRTNAQLYGILAMRFAGADSPPYAFSAIVPALRAGVLRLQGRAQRDGRTIELAPLRAAVTALGASARAADDGIARGRGPAASRVLDAAQNVDRVAYGASAEDGVTYPTLAAAYDANDDAALRAAIDAAAAAISRAAADLR